MYAVTGLDTSIVRGLAELTGERMMRIRCDPSMLDLGCSFIFDSFFDVAKDGRHGRDPITGYVLAAGVIHSIPLWAQTADQVAACAAVNFINTLRLADQILNVDDNAKVAIIGSASGRLGSFDMLYAAAKAGVHGYVTMKPTKKTQQLVAIAPPIISDSGMVRGRHDYPEVLKLRRCVSGRDVAHAILEAFSDGLTNHVTWL